MIGKECIDNCYIYISLFHFCYMFIPNTPIRLHAIFSDAK